MLSWTIGSEIRDCIAYDNGLQGGNDGAFRFLGASEACLIDNVVAYNNGQGIEACEVPTTGFMPRLYPDVPFPGAPRSCTVQNSILYNNRKNYENSDGLGLRYATNMIVRNNIAFNNVDDGFDIVGAVDNLIEGNIAFNNGDFIPEAGGPNNSPGNGDGNGIKISTRGGGGNIVRNNVCFGNERAGFDDDDGIANIYYNNVAYDNIRYGFVIENQISNMSGFPGSVVLNNISFNRSNDTGVSDAASASPPLICDYNYWADGNFPADEGSHSLAAIDATGPKFNDPYYRIDPDPNTPETGEIRNSQGLIDTAWQGTVSATIDHIRSQVFTAFSLIPDSDAIDTGGDIQLIISNLHDQTTVQVEKDIYTRIINNLLAPYAVDGDNDGNAAYDMGAFEYGLVISDPDPEPEPDGITSNAVPDATSLNVYNNIIKPSENNEAIIIADIQTAGNLDLKIYDTSGRKIITLFDGDHAAGSPEFRWKGTDSAGNMIGSGIYFVHMESGGYSETKKIAVVK